ncbi:FAD-dependent oxidoreductase [Salipiger mucosus]|uniref:Putative xanthan lyase n=1 Tax=Salipiger mucosus DSM 16094 TaxID=1123237 RepID=S9RNL4_9RHOB|nr:FAD-dependent oxidoreductase [Salipiger mucosus]EPX75559.1 putative xanthan lyase [Salipiger mucosus DSM 16094]
MTLKNVDIAIFRATPAGIIAAVAAARLGFSVTIVESGPQVGGMMTSGLNATDAVGKSWITGVSREFFIRARMHYGTHFLPSRIESKVAGAIFRTMLDEAGVEVLRDTRIEEVRRSGRTISQARLSDGTVLAADWWMDASYEGDLMAMAFVSYRLGRESRDEFDEPWAGRQRSRSLLPWGGGRRISPKVGDSFRPWVDPPSNLPLGSADRRVQSYCIRPTLTNINVPHLRVPIERPEDFDFSAFDIFRELARDLGSAAVRSTWHRNMGTTFKSAYFNLAELPNGKWDMNSGPLAPINNPALTDGWAEASHETRAGMTEAFRRYTQAILWFIQNDPAVPVAVRAFFSDFGLPGDEYTDSGHLPPEVYVREGRRLMGENTFTQHHVEGGGVGKDEEVCEGRYFLDCKPVSWMANREMTNVVREGMFMSGGEPLRYSIPAWVMLPRRGDTTNFFALCGVSASHVAFGSFRMEPIWMELGNVAPIIAWIAGQRGCLPHEVDPAAVRRVREQRFTHLFENDLTPSDFVSQGQGGTHGSKASTPA